MNLKNNPNNYFGVKIKDYGNTVNTIFSKQK